MFCDVFTLGGSSVILLTELHDVVVNKMSTNSVQIS